MVYRHMITMAVYNQGFATLQLHKAKVLDSMHADVVTHLVTNPVTEEER